MKTSELTGAALDWAVAKCEGVVTGNPQDGNDIGFILEGGYSPSTYWDLAGPIIEREGVGLMETEMGSGEWEACKWIDPDTHIPLIECGPTPLMAAMRCYVASRLGSEVDIPEELTGVAA